MADSDAFPLLSSAVSILLIHKSIFPLEKTQHKHDRFKLHLLKNSNQILSPPKFIRKFIHFILIASYFLQFLQNPLISVRTIPKLHSKATDADTNGFYIPSPEETIYDLLGISENGTLSNIKRAYKQMALKYHPDVSPPDRANEYTTRFLRVQEAYETLSDPESRAMYDSIIAKGLYRAFSGKKGSRFRESSEEKARWKQSWEAQLEELKRQSTVDTARVGLGGRMSWAARISQQRSEACTHGSDPDL